MRILSLLMGLYALTAWSAPPPGHPSVGEAERLLKIPDRPGLSWTGQVLEAQNSNNYTFIQVQTRRTRVWLAAPRIDLHPGQRIRFGPGRVMHNFFSRKHQRLFERIMFVGPVELLPERI